MRTATRFPAKMNYRRLTEIDSRYYGLSLLRRLTCGPECVRNKGSSLYVHPLIGSSSMCCFQASSPDEKALVEAAVR